MSKEKIIHSFDRTDPLHECYGEHDTRTVLCGITESKEFKKQLNTTDKIRRVWG